MDFIHQLNRLIGLYVSAIKSIFKTIIWLPFFLYAVLQLGVLTMCAFYVHPYIYPILSPLVAFFGDTRAELFGHYPGLYLLLPLVYQWGKLALGIIFEGLATGLTVVLFADYFGRHLPSRWRLSEAFRAWPQLFMGWLIITGILFIINWYLPETAANMLRQSPRRAALFDLGLRLVTVAVYSMFIYALPALIVLRQNLFRAFATSFGYFFKYPLFSFFLALIPYLISLPVSFLARNSEVIVTRFTPELIYYILLIGIIIDMFINYLLTGAVTKFLIDAQE